MSKQRIEELRNQISILESKQEELTIVIRELRNDIELYEEDYTGDAEEELDITISEKDEVSSALVKLYAELAEEEQKVKE